MIEIKIKESYDSLDKVLNYLSKESEYKCKKVYNIWEAAIGAKTEKCILIKKNAFIGLKADFVKKNVLKLKPVVPHNMLIAFTVGRGIFPPIVRAILSGPQNKMLTEVADVFDKIKQKGKS